jgi:predicted transposase YbfD/YdcC
MRSVDVARVENHLAHFSCSQEHYRHKEDKKEKRPRLVGQSVDGKELRGARAHGRPICLVSLVRHGSGRVMAQRSVERKSNEIKAVPYLLEGQDLRGTVTTMDALLTQRAIAQQIVNGGGHYLMGVKANQRELYLATEELFSCPPWLTHERKANYRCYTKVEKGHGRIEKRTLESSPAMREYLQEYLYWPGGEQVMRRTCQRVIVSTGEISEEVKYAVTSLRWEQADAIELERLWRGHWTIENSVHHVRDVTMGEDANQMRVGNAPQVLAALRNAVLNVIRSKGWINIADALRHYGAFVHRALALVTTS